MDLLANRETAATRDEICQIIITPATTANGTIAIPLAPTVIQHAIPLVTNPPPSPPRPRTALLLVPAAATLRPDARQRTKTQFYKPHDIRAVTAALRAIMNLENPPPALFPTDNDSFILSDIDIMRSYAIDTLFDSEYHIGNTEESETTEALQAPDSEHCQERSTQPHLGDHDPAAYHQKAGRRIRREQ
jgi:hypothetical protein